ncbi:adenylyl-sulfate kinase 3-like isoform X1 [Senna tora]|uniref:Adenylyl-sulfate kinase n=1 Tax=Senna tora TaxID=362788 RepID=A0A835CI20_9FABA|nr:adenylyl-sulfate kinase 3-like isoform X1 [Senna tora]
MIGIATVGRPRQGSCSPVLGPRFETSSLPNLGFLRLKNADSVVILRSRDLLQMKAIEGSTRASVNGMSVGGDEKNPTDLNEIMSNGHAGSSGKHVSQLTTIGNSTNIQWHNCSLEKVDRQKLLDQRGCVIWITGLSGSGKSTLACALSRILHQRGKLSYVLDGDNLRHGLNKDLSFRAEDRAENIRRVGEVAKLFADAGVICIASLISPYKRDRDACRALLPNGDFIEVFVDVPLEICEARDPKGLYKLARAGKIKELIQKFSGFTGIDDPYETPLNSEIVLKHGEPCSSSPTEMAEKVVFYLEEKGYLQQA